MSRDDWDDDDRPRRRRRRNDDDYDDAPRIDRGGDESIGLSVTSMVLGIVSVAIFCIWFLSVPLAILAIIFGAVGASKGGKGMAIAGMVCGMVAIVILLIFFLVAMLSPTQQFGPMWWWRA